MDFEWWIIWRHQPSMHVSVFLHESRSSRISNGETNLKINLTLNGNFGILEALPNGNASTIGMR